VWGDRSIEPIAPYLHQSLSGTKRADRLLPAAVARILFGQRAAPSAKHPTCSCETPVPFGVRTEPAVRRP
jgi:hypothetical protein